MASRTKDNKRMTSAQAIKEAERKAREERMLQRQALQDSSGMAAIEQEAAKAIKNEQAEIETGVKESESLVSNEVSSDVSKKIVEEKPVETTKVMPTSEPFEVLNAPIESEVKVEIEKPKTKSKKSGYVKSAKRRVEKTVSDVKTIKKEIIPEESKNYAFTQSFSVDEDTMNHLEAVVELLQKSGLTIDDRLITVSSFTRRAVQRELQNTYNVNGPEFKKAVEDIIRGKNEPLSFKLG